SVNTKLEVVAPGMSVPSSCHAYANVRGDRKREAPSRSDVQPPGLQVSASPRLAPPEIAGASPSGWGASSNAAKAGSSSPWRTVDGDPEPSRVPVRICPPQKVPQ